jgi:hypothetical protein
MKILELFEATPQVVAAVPGDKISEIPAGARPSGEYPTPITQAGPQTSNTPKTTQPTGFTPGSTPSAPAPGSSAVTQQPVPGQTATPATTPQTTAPANNDQQSMKDELQGLKMQLMRMQNAITPPPAPPN